MDLDTSATAQLLEGHPDAAAPLYERAITQQEVQQNSPRFAVDLSNLALAYDMIGRQAEAKQTYERAVPMLEKALGPDDPELARCLANLSRHYWSAGAPTRAQQLGARALAIAEKTLGPDDPKTMLVRQNVRLMQPPTPAGAQGPGSIRAGSIADQDGAGIMGPSARPAPLHAGSSG